MAACVDLTILKRVAYLTNRHLHLGGRSFLKCIPSIRRVSNVVTKQLITSGDFDTLT